MAGLGGEKVVDDGGHSPTRLSTKFTLRSDCRIRQGGGRAQGTPFDWTTYVLVRRGCLRSSGGTAASTGLGTGLCREPCSEPLAASDCSPSFSQCTSTGFVEVDEMELWVELPSREKMEEEEEEAEDETEDA